MNISDVCFLFACEVRRGEMETMERRDAIDPSHINSLLDGRGEGAVREGTVCLCLPLERAVFLMEPEINRGERESGEREADRSHNAT